MTASGKIEVRRAPVLTGLSVSWVKRVVSETLRLEKAKRRSVSVFLTNNRRIRKINKRFLKHDYATDVISFGLGRGARPCAPTTGEGSDYLGDLVVSVEMARSVSKKLGISFKEELARYLVHGTLHLLDYEDEEKKDRVRMHRRQETILRRVL